MGINLVKIIICHGETAELTIKQKFGGVYNENIHTLCKISTCDYYTY